MKVYSAGDRAVATFEDCNEHDIGLLTIGQQICAVSSTVNHVYCADCGHGYAFNKDLSVQSEIVALGGKEWLRLTEELRNELSGLSQGTIEDDKG